MGKLLRRLQRGQGGRQRGTAVPPELGGRIAELRRLVVDARQISDCLEYFHDHLALDKSFMSLGVNGDNPTLEAMVRAASKRAIADFEIGAFQLVHLAEHGFWHGSGQGAKSGLSVFFYFDDIAVGATHVVASMGSHQNHFVRFNGFPLDQPFIPGPVRRGQT